METKLYVGNLNFRTTEASLGAAFAEAGFQVVSVKIITDRETNRSRGFAFVEMADEQAAKEALARMHDYNVDGRPLKVTEAKPRAPGGFSGGGDRGGYGGGDRGGFRSQRPPLRDGGDERGAPRFAPPADARPRFGHDAPRLPRQNFGGEPPRGNFGGGGAFMPPQPEEGRENRRGKRRDLSKQHAERQDFDDDDDWA